jgi:hypothetical protein
MYLVEIEGAGFHHVMIEAWKVRAGDHILRFAAETVRKLQDAGKLPAGKILSTRPAPN